MKHLLLKAFLFVNYHSVLSLVIYSLFYIDVQTNYAWPTQGVLYKNRCGNNGGYSNSGARGKDFQKLMSSKKEKEL